MAPLVVRIKQVVNGCKEVVDSAAAVLDAWLNQPRFDIHPANKVTTAEIGITAVHSQSAKGVVNLACSRTENTYLKLWQSNFVS